MAPQPLNAALTADTSGIDGSSLDELALSRLGAHTPLAPRSTNTQIQKISLGATPKLQSSPAKSVYLETPGVQGSSPFRFKFTVQAERISDQEDAGTPSKRGTNKTTVVKVPLKDADEPVKRKRGRPRKSDAGTSAGQADGDPSAIKKRKGTPMKRQSKRISGSSEAQAEFGDPHSGMETSSPKRRTGRPSKIVPQADTDGESTPPKKKMGRPRKPLQAGTTEESPSPKKKMGRPRKKVPQAEPDVVFTDQESLEEETAEKEPAENYEPSPSEAESSEISARPTEELSPTLETPSVGQSTRYYKGRSWPREARPVDSPAGTRRIRASRPTNSELRHVRYPSQELPASSRHRIASAEVQSQPDTSRALQIDFTKLTPLHEKHIIAPAQPIHRHMPARSTPRPELSAAIVPGWNGEIHSPSKPQEALMRDPFTRRSNSAENADEPSQVRYALPKEPTPAPPHSGGSSPAEQFSTSPEAKFNERNQDEEMWRQMIPDRADDESTEGEATPASDSDESDYEELGDVTGRPMGEATLMQSEEFSMVSLDSLESVRDIHSSFVGGSQAGTGDHSMNEPRQTQRAPDNHPQQLISVKRASKLKQAWLPGSSPDAHLSPNVSVQRGRQSSRPLSSPYSPRIPSQNRQSSPQYSSHLNESRRLGARLSSEDFESSPVGAAPMSSFLIANKQQRSVNVSSPGKVDDNNDDWLVEPPVAPHSANGRLPTPNSTDKESQNTGSSRLHTEPNPAGQQFQRSTPLEPDRSPAKSDSVASMQSQTPPLTDQGSSPVIEYATRNTMSSAAAQQLPSSPPSRIAHSGGLEETRQWRLKQEALEQTWQAAKKQLSPSSQLPNRSIIILSDHSHNDDSDDEEVEKNKEIAVEEDIEDLWQEEASRASQIGDSKLPDRPRHIDSEVKRKLFSNAEKPPSSRLTKVPRTIRPFSASPDQDRHVQSKDPSLNLEQERQKKISSTIADLFKNVTGTSADSEHMDDTSPTNPVERILPALDGSGSKITKKAKLDTSRSAGRCDSPLSPKHIRSSQLRRQLTPETDPSFERKTNSFISIASDVQQLRNELTSSQKVIFEEKRPPQANSNQVYSTRTTTQKIPVNLRSVDDSIQSEHEQYDNSSLMSLNPKRPVKPLFQGTQEQLKNPFIVKASQRVETMQSEAAPKAEHSPVEGKSIKHAPAPSMFHRFWANLPSVHFITPSTDQSENGPPRPKHRLLKDLPLLPRTLPFTKTHYKAMEELWNRYKKAPEQFLTSQQQNAGLMTKSLSKFADVTMSEWDYEATLKPSSLILVALFMRLLVLRDEEEFEQVEGREIEMGLPGTLWCEGREKEKAEGKKTWKMDELVIGEAFVVMRLFAIMVCESVREDEGKGLEINRGLKFKWRVKGEKGWNYSLLVSE